MRISDWSSDVCSSDLTALRNVQPLYADLATGGFAIAHNGNLSNAMRLRRDLVRSGSIFQSTSDTETIIHLVATSSYRTLLDKFIDALRRVEGAYSLIAMTPEGMIACRDPLDRKSTRLNSSH